MSGTGLLQSVAYAIVASKGFYALFLGVLTIPFFQNQVIYLSSVTLTWFQDVTVPEQWGFLHNQVTPFTLRTSDGETLHAWHILPLGLYQEHEEELLAEPAGVAEDFRETLGFKLLRDDPDSLLRGFGSSSGSPSEEGLLIDAITLAEWAMEEAGIPPSRIVLFSQSIGTAVSVALAHHMATKPEPVLFSGMVLVAPFVDVELLTATYRVAGIIPILDPIARFPRLLAYLNSFILSNEGPKYHVNIIHAEDDYDIPWTHSEQVFWHAVNASTTGGITFGELEKKKAASRSTRGAGGWVVEHSGGRGLIREEITKYGLHDRIMSYPVVSAAVLRGFESSVA
ncbi:hypothetical protein DL765_004437 [Monosporascus sp. GIB2]|nr:hypothetical protein DL765_004437 [Monosporascus sp. GIB2]